jgi:hypothetical protein
MTKKELLERIEWLEKQERYTKKDIIELRQLKQETDSALLKYKALFEKQEEINNLLAKELGGEIVEEDYVWGGELMGFMGRVSVPKEIRTRQVFKNNQGIKILERTKTKKK